MLYSASCRLDLTSDDLVNLSDGIPFPPITREMLTNNELNILLALFFFLSFFSKQKLNRKPKD